MKPLCSSQLQTSSCEGWWLLFCHTACRLLAWLLPQQRFLENSVNSERRKKRDRSSISAHFCRSVYVPFASVARVAFICGGGDGVLGVWSWASGSPCWCCGFAFPVEKLGSCKRLRQSASVRVVGPVCMRKMPPFPSPCPCSAVGCLILAFVYKWQEEQVF